MNYLIDPLTEIKEYNDILESVKNYSIPINISGPSDSQKAHISYAICQHAKCKGIYVAFNEMQARRLYSDFSFFLGDEVLFFPSKEIILHHVEARSYDAVFQRIRVLDRLVQGKYKIIVTSAEAISQKLITRELFKKNIENVVPGSKLELSSFIGELLNTGYERVGIVEGTGQFAVRGGIIDIFPTNSDFAVRIELFDDEVDSIRKFDVFSQRSIDRLQSVRIAPAREIVYSEDRKQHISDNIEKDLNIFERNALKLNKKMESKETSLIYKVREDIDKIRNECYVPRMDMYIPYLIETPSHMFEHTDQNTVIFIDEQERVKQRNVNILLEHHEMCCELMGKNKILPASQDIYFSYNDISTALSKRKIVNLSTISGVRSDASKQINFSIASKQKSSYMGHFKLLLNDIKYWKDKKDRIVLLSGSRDKGERLAEAFQYEGIEAHHIEDAPSEVMQGQVVITRGTLNKGFEYHSIGFHIVSSEEISGKSSIKKFKSSDKSRDKSKINIFADLNTGDYVVHRTHGIGQYVGTEKLVVENIKKDYLKIRYQSGDYLYIPANQLDLIQKYIGSESKTPKLNKLGGTDWVRTKRKVKESLKELAAELIKLYAQRQSQKGFVYSKDTVWQKQFEDLFPYQETEDQLKCIDDIKNDMTSDKTMDRLLCGDVGYGKTEVAMRAAFKAVMGEKQVAYLVPTTVLAQQHYNNFKERMKNFPVTVDVLSRFRTQGEQQKIVKNIKSGKIDIIIGTHRIIQKDVKFKDLGLLIIDEEQRFGVKHKEKLKDIKPNVDVLTLTATPIPRTLHMSLVGIRNISVIEDPPEERYPIQTYVMEYNRDVIRDAIIREISRDGQVFYLYNRVKSIDLKAFEIKSLIEDARVAIAHGQMGERQLENTMLDFIKGKYDILVCTTIIESGLDMPNVNTIIVENADNMGLSQLYQLRGRVGRSNKLAYAYITYRKDKIISEIAEKRLQAIKEFTEFGAGFKIAMRDMEIRGAGNLLGPEQHGHMESVGYDMYCKLLDEAVREQKGEPVNDEEAEMIIDIKVNAYIDNEYINIENQRIEMYRKIALIQDKQDVLDIKDELIDRYGDLPEAVINLISIAYIKAIAKNIGLSSISEKNDSVIFKLGKAKKIDIAVIAGMAEKYKRKIMFNAGNEPYILYKKTAIDGDELLHNIKIMLHDIKSFEVL